MIKRIVMFRGGVETLEYFSDAMAEKFEQMGYTVFFFDLKNEEYSAKKLRKFLKPRETVLITFNFEGLEKEDGVYREGIGYIWDTYGIPCYNIAADHPYFYHERLCDLPKDYHHISIDRRHGEYFRNFYPEYRDEGFLPLAGCTLPEPAQEGERDIDVIFAGNYTELPFFEPYINWINEEYAAFYRGIIDELLTETDQTVEEVAQKHCEREMGKVPYEDLRMAMHKMIFIDMYVRNYWRGTVVKTLVDAGIRVEVVGKGWEKLDCTHPENLVIHPQTDTAGCLEMIARAKISINVMPWFKDGAHDRVFSSILNGAVCLSDVSDYLCGQLAEGEGVCYYHLNDLSGLPGQVKTLLQDEMRRKEIIAAGQKKVQEQHLWANRAETLAQWFGV
ncbi:MAG: glycosyltransferase family 1 protein [Roseburia sp.]|nr:glycosyltransferase family 1 protein [Roseburia sp.]